MISLSVWFVRYLVWELALNASSEARLHDVGVCGVFPYPKNGRLYSAGVMCRIDFTAL